MFPEHIFKLAENVLSSARAKKLRIVTAESCTGGLISGVLTEVSGSSDVFDRGFITYSYESKTDLLGVDPEVLKKAGAVSADIAAQMAVAALKSSAAQVSVAVTGIAGPGGATPEKPLGLVYMAIASRHSVRIIQNNFFGGRSEVRIAAVEKALHEIMAEISRF